jgi:hypothetical protein
MSRPLSAYSRTWIGRAHTVVRYGAYGALFAGGALVLADLIGPAVARDLGTAGGQGFATGVARAQETIAQVSTRGRRFL